MGLKMARNALSVLSLTPGYEAGYTAAYSVVNARINQLNNLATDVVDIGVAGDFVRTGLTTASATLGAIDFGYRVWNGDISIPSGGAEASVMLAGAILSRNKLSVNIAAESAAPNIVYRGLTEADAIALQSGRGLTAKAPGGSWSAADHVSKLGPGTGGPAANSPWISTSKLRDVAQAYDSGHGVAMIDLNKVKSLQVEVWQNAPRVNGEAGLAYHRSIWSQEVTVYQTIPREAIIWPK